MPIQNIDSYLMANRSQEASIIKSLAEGRRPAEQYFLNGEVRHKAERDLTRTKETVKAELSEKRFDAKDKGKNEYLRQKQKPASKKSKSKSSEKLSEPAGRTIDIKL